MENDLERIITELCEIHAELRKERPDVVESTGLNDAISKLMDLEFILFEDGAEE